MVTLVIFAITHLFAHLVLLDSIFNILEYVLQIVLLLTMLLMEFVENVHILAITATTLELVCLAKSVIFIKEVVSGHVPVQHFIISQQIHVKAAQQTVHSALL